MKLPNHEQAAIDSAKLRDYLLSRSHPVGRFKAAFFATLGYSEDSGDELAGGLRLIARDGTVEAEEPSEFGRKYRVRGVLAGPNGRLATVVTVWVVLDGEVVPRLVTAFPGE